MRVTIDTVIPAAAETVWRHLLTPALLDHVAWPLLVFQPRDPPAKPAVWREGDYHVAMRAFGLLPLGTQRVGIRILEAEAWPRVLRDDGGGTLVRVWRHDIRIEPLAANSTRYRDTVEIAAGPLTPLIWLYAQLFYRWRQHRWRQLARTGYRALSR